jgi:hypothetical protein
MAGVIALAVDVAKIKVAKITSACNKTARSCWSARDEAVPGGRTAESSSSVIEFVLK